MFDNILRRSKGNALSRAWQWLEQGPESPPRTHKNESVLKMFGDLAREAGILLMVFTFLDASKLGSVGVALLEVGGALLVLVGVKIERRRKE